MHSFSTAGKKALATFIFATAGVVVGSPLVGIEAEAWKLAIGTGIGALINLAYRWSESVLKHEE
jgi:hypothetical protein